MADRNVGDEYAKAFSTAEDYARKVLVNEMDPNTFAEWVIVENAVICSGETHECSDCWGCRNAKELKVAQLRARYWHMQYAATVARSHGGTTAVEKVAADEMAAIRSKLQELGANNSVEEYEDADV